ncbi:UDP-glucose 4-epimerase [hydrothermal vent metagenome]|uniref:UDP-glucose 4-epimerase n=1 Tax=hydrothermal vent metagenome TaxID=652676 RepID=A0A3B0ZPP4_9ZZZZ
MNINKAFRILVTGGFGYVGGRLAKTLANKGHQVILGSRKKCTVPEWLPGSEVVRMEWEEEDSLASIFQDVNIVIHTAGMNAGDCVKDPVSALQCNGLTTARITDISRRAGVSKFLYLSTAHVYRAPLIGDIDEDTCPRNLHPYATSHLAGENFVLHSSRNNDEFIGVVLRLSNVVGAPVHKDVNCWMLVVNDLCRQAIANKKINVRSNGSSVRDFVSMRVVSECIEEIINTSKSKCESLVFNIGSGRSVTIKDLSILIKKRCEVLFGFSPEINMECAIHKPIDEFLAYKSKEVDFNVYNQVSLESDIDETLLYCAQEWIS